MKLGIYAGTFNPFHVGHLNIYHKAEEIFDKVIVAAGVNPSKATAPNAVQVPEYVELIKYSGLTTTLIKEYIQQGNKVTLIRGIRNGYDYDYEMNQISVMKDLYADLQVILIPCDNKYSYISSTMIRELYKFDKVAAKQYVPTQTRSLLQF